MYRRSMFYLATLAIVFLPRPAVAEKILEAKIANVSGQPVVIEECDAKLTGDTNDALLENVKVHNDTSNAVKAIKVRFILFDAFDTNLGSRDGYDDDGIQPGFEPQAEWTFSGLSGSIVNYTVCEVTNVRFVDGDTWERPSS